MNQLNFSDMFQKSFLALSSGTAVQLSPLYIVVNITLSFVVAMFIFFVYRRTFQGVLYQRTFNISLVVTSVVTSLIIMTISGNLILSLGMVGALSIVRFRTPIKDSMDLAFLFWAISVGIANGVGYYTISVIGSLLLAAILFFLTRSQGLDGNFLMVAQLVSADLEAKFLEELYEKTEMARLKSKVVTEEYTELIVEVKLLDNAGSFMNILREEGVIRKGTLVSCSGDLSSV